MIQALVVKGDKDALKNMSQHPIWNAWYEIEFGSQNNYGVHGACPIEQLHWINLGKYKYSRRCLFFQMGPTSKLSKAINATAVQMGFLFQRQSDRDKPRTRFSKGVMKGKLMGHEMSGMMLVLAATLRSQRGRKLILDTARGKQKDFFANEKFITDWSMLIETQLQFEAYLTLPELNVATVERLKIKILELMGMEKQIAKRTEGMKHTTMNFHGGRHVPEDILNFGAPMHVNTRNNEMHHKKDKKSAKRTQKRLDTFDLQCAQKIQQRKAIDYAICEINGRAKWNYFEERKQSTSAQSPRKDKPAQQLTGAKAEFYKNPITGSWGYRVHSEMQNRERFVYDEWTEASLLELAQYLEPFSEWIWTYTELSVKGEGSGDARQTYRASPYYEGKPWQDWAMFDLSVEHPLRDYVAGQIMCFVNLSAIPENNPLNYAPGVYAIIHPATPVVEGDELSEIFKPYTKGLSETDEGVPYTTFEMVNVNTIIEPCACIPDLDHENPRAYLLMKRRGQWTDTFEAWLNEPHAREFDEEQTIPASFLAKKRRKKKKKEAAAHKKSESQQQIGYLHKTKEESGRIN